MKLKGKVAKKQLYAGTKSEHEGLVLITSDGEFKLQRKGGNPFWDDVLAELEGKEIEAKALCEKQGSSCPTGLSCPNAIPKLFQESEKITR